MIFVRGIVDRGHSSVSLVPSYVLRSYLRVSFFLFHFYLSCLSHPTPLSVEKENPNTKKESRFEDPSYRILLLSLHLFFSWGAKSNRRTDRKTTNRQTPKTMPNRRCWSHPTTHTNSFRFLFHQAPTHCPKYRPATGSILPIHPNHSINSSNEQKRVESK